MNTILVIDDEPNLRDVICQTLEESGYAVVRAGNGREALQKLADSPVDMIVTDIEMPDLNGYQLLERIRSDAAWAATPFLFLSGRNLNSDIRFGKELGADDYLTKPVMPEDLLAAVRGKFRRTQQLLQHQNQLSAPVDTKAEIELHLRCGLLKINLDQHRVWLNNDSVELTAREFTLLTLLAEKHHKVLSPEAIVSATHKIETDDYMEASNLVRPYIRSVRRKLGYPVGKMGCIENVRGVGYRLETACQK